MRTFRLTVVIDNIQAPDVTDAERVLIARKLADVRAELQRLFPSSRVLVESTWQVQR